MIKDIKHIGFKNSSRPSAQFDLIRMEEMLSRSYDDHSPFKPHLVNFYLIIMVESGKGIHSIDFKDYECVKGTVFTIRKNQIQSFQKDSSLKGRMLLFTNDFLCSYLEPAQSMRSKQLFNEVLGSQQTHLSAEGLNEFQDIVNRMEKEYNQVHDAYSMRLVRSELHILITRLMRTKSKTSSSFFERKYLKDFVRFHELTEELVFRTVKVKDYAERLGISTKTLNTISKSIANMSAKEFIDEVCVMHIKRLLINTDSSIKEIAFDSGFEETSNFFKYFKRLTGVTPEEFRNRL